jgi:hypothetical protein
MATATIQVAYEAETTSLKATVNEINQINDKVVQGAQESASKVKKEYTGIANSFAAAFSGGEVKKALDNQAKAIDNVGKSGKSLTGQLRGLKQELAQLEIAGQDGTEAFNKLLIAASKLEDQIGDTRARVKILASDTFKFDAAVGATQALASGFELAQGAAALFGEENEDLQQALVKITAATAVANSVQQLSALIKEENAVKTAVLTARTFAATAAQAAFTTVVGASTGAMKVFRLALAATGVGLLVIGLIALVENFDKVKQFAFNAVPGLEGFAEGVGKVIDKTKELFGIDDGGAGGKAALDRLVGLEKRKTAFRIAEIDRNINLLEAQNKDTTALEIQKEQIQIESLKRQIKAVRDNSDELLKLDIETRKEIREAAQDAANEVLDRENAIQVIKIDAANKAAEAIKKALEKEKKDKEEAQKEDIDRLKKRVALGNEVNDRINKEREEALKEQLDAVAVAENASFELKIESLEKQRDIEVAAAEEAGQLTYDITKKYDEQITQLKINSAESRANTEINNLKTLEISEGSTLERRLELINKEAEKRKTEATNTIKDKEELDSKIKLIDAETQKDITNTKKDETEKQIALIAAYAQAVASVFNGISELSKLQTEKRIEDIQAVSDKELEAINASTDLERDKERQRAALAKRTNAAIAAEKTKQAKADKALAIFQATISVAQQVAQNLANPALAIIIAAAGAIQIAAIAARPIPKFERGGVVGGRRHTDGGTMVEAERDEFIVNRRQSMRHRSELDAINSSSDAFRKLIEQRYVRPALMDYVAGNRNKQGVTVNASLNSKSMEKKLDTINKSLKNRNMTININQQDSRYLWQ